MFKKKKTYESEQIKTVATLNKMLLSFYYKSHYCEHQSVGSVDNGWQNQMHHLLKSHYGLARILENSHYTRNTHTKIKTHYNV